MTRRFWILNSAAVLLTACGASVGVGSNGVDHLASTRIRTTSSTAVNQAVSKVFQNDGFAIISRTDRSITFSKVGGRSADIAWKTIGNDNPVLIQPTVTWRPEGAGMTWLGCSVNVVQQSDAFGNTVRKPIFAGKAAYNGLLDKVKRQVESGR